MLLYLLKNYYKCEVARPLIKSNKQLCICPISYSVKTHLICYFYLQCMFEQWPCFQVINNNILFTDDNKHAKTMKLQNGPNLLILQSQLHIPLAPYRQLVTSLILTSSLIKTKQSSISFGKISFIVL